MFLRFTSRTNADGSVVRYVALAHNRRVDGRIRPDVLMNLGRADQVDVAGLRRLAASISKHYGDGDGRSDAVEAFRPSALHEQHGADDARRGDDCPRRCTSLARCEHHARDNVHTRHLPGAGPSTATRSESRSSS